MPRQSPPLLLRPEPGNTGDQSCLPLLVAFLLEGEIVQYAAGKGDRRPGIRPPVLWPNLVGCNPLYRLKSSYLRRVANTSSPPRPFARNRAAPWSRIGFGPAQTRAGATAKRKRPRRYATAAWPQRSYRWRPSQWPDSTTSRPWWRAGTWQASRQRFDRERGWRLYLWSAGICLIDCRPYVLKLLVPWPRSVLSQKRPWTT